MMKKMMMMSVSLLGSLMNATMNATLLNTTLLHESMVQSQYTEVPGSDMDTHGCVGSAGYTWCASSDTCVRTWETPCPPIIDQPLIITDVPCNDVMCDLHCDNGFRVNEQGCSMCICNEGILDGIPNGCVSWFDGCNTCSVLNGVTQVCSMMYCITDQSPYCLLYSDAGH